MAEAFAATRSVTIPSQSRAWLRADGRDLLRRFRQLAPERPPISIQHWSWRRIGLLAGVLVAAGVVTSLALALLGAAGRGEDGRAQHAARRRRGGPALALSAAAAERRQRDARRRHPECHPGSGWPSWPRPSPPPPTCRASPTRTAPWRFSSLTVEQGRARLSLVYIDPDGALGPGATTPPLRHPRGQRAAPGGGADRRRALPPGLDPSPRLAGVDYAVFEGRCVTTEYDLPRNADASERLLDLDTTVGLYPRARLSASWIEFHLDLDEPPDAT